MLVYDNPAEPDHMFSIGVTFDGQYALLYTNKDCDDLCMVSFIDLTDNPLNGKLEFKPLITEWLGGFTRVHNIGSKVFFKTNYKAPKSKVIMIDLDNFNLENPSESMQDVLPEHARNVLNDVECYNGMLVAFYLEDASDKI